MKIPSALPSIPKRAVTAIFGPLRSPGWMALAVATGIAVASVRAVETGRDPFVMQDARSRFIAKFDQTSYYPADSFDLSGLPAYVPEQQVAGVLRVWGSDMFGGVSLRGNLAEEFRKFQPGVKIEYNLKSNLLAVSGLLDGTAQIGQTHVLTWETLLAFQRLYNYDPLTIRGMTGWMLEPPFAIMVNKANPIAGLTLEQLDGIYGAERSGGWTGTNWHPERARGPEANIRTWGQLGLTGEWKDRPIVPFSYALRCMFGVAFSDMVLGGSDKWNEKVREKFNVTQPDGTLLGMDQQMANDLATDPSGIAFFSILRGKSDQVRPVALSATRGAPYISLNLQTVRDHSYPLSTWIYFYINRKPGTPLDPTLKEFMRFLLSREGQTLVVRDGKMLPLTAEQIRVERRKLE
jgi:phosphate transport system substrate-binding protein